MLSQRQAKLAAVHTARGRYSRFHFRGLIAVIAASALLAGCLPATVPLVNSDPANPGAKVARVGYRSTVGSYVSMRPSTPAPWRERNDSVAPKPDR